MGESFDVSQLRVVESGTMSPNNIVDPGENFELEATIAGNGLTWANLINSHHKVKAQFYAEGMGPGVPDQDFGHVFLDIPGNNFAVKSAPVNVPDAGIYRCGVVVSVWDNGQTNSWVGWLGYNEDCLLQVNEEDQP